MDAARDSLNRPLGAVGGFLSALIGVFMGVSLFSHTALFLLPLAPIGVYIGLRSTRTTDGSSRGFGLVGIVLNSTVIVLFLYAAIRYLVE